MKNKTFNMISGLPRTGSTLLCNILNQNPRFHLNGTSGVLDLTVQTRNFCNNSDLLKASPVEHGNDNVIKGILHNYFASVKEPVVFDKSRPWLGFIELLELVLGQKAKIIVTVRDVVDILASMEKLYRKNPSHQFPQEKSHPVQWQTIQGRCDVLTDATSPIGASFNYLKDALHRGFKDRLLLVEYNDLTSSPRVTLKRIYDFIDEEYFEHNLTNVEQTIYENDDIHGIPNLHSIRSTIEPVKSDAKELLGEELFNKYSNAEFWRGE